MTKFLSRSLLLSVACLLTFEAHAQEAPSGQTAPPSANGQAPAPAPPAGTPPAGAAQPAPAAGTTTAQPPKPAGTTVPEVEVIQEKKPAPPPAPPVQAQPKPLPPPVAQPKPLPAPVYTPPPVVVAKPKPKPAPPPAAAPPPPPADIVEAPAPASEPVSDQAPSNPNPVYGAANSQGAAARATQSATPPVNPTQIIPSNLEGFSSAASKVDSSLLKERQSSHINDALRHVPGVMTTNDDAASHHGGIGVRGSPPRRSRKVLVMEDGHANNLALWLDPSVHYFAPLDRVEEFEVLRGTVIVHGPNNNFGVINARNLSPFGKNQTVVSSSIGMTENDTGSFTDEDGNVISGSDDRDFSARWHMHTRQMVNNVGLVFSYTGENIQGTWDTERLRAHDFYGALGFKGSSSDVTVAASYVRQRDTYDENNFEGDEDGGPGNAEDGFFGVKHCHTCFAPGSIYNNYNGEIWRGRITHNAYLDDDTTLTSRIYAQHHRRDRYQIITAEQNPDDAVDAGAPAVFDGPDADGLFEIIAPNDSMFGRLRTFRHIGFEQRLELANRAFFAGMKQDIQVGYRYEYQDMANRNFIGASGEKLKDGDETGLTIFDRSLDANTFSAFLQTNIHVTSDFKVVPGVRFEYYKVKRQSRVTAEEEGEAEEEDSANDGGDCAENPAIDPDEECLVIEGIRRTPFNDGFEQFHTLPGISFAYTGLTRSTIFGGYHRGMSTGVLRNEDFPYEDETGDNFQLGFRTAAIKGLGFEVTGFHQRIHDFQFGASFSSAGDRSFGKAERVDINGVELAARIDSHAYTGGPLNVFGAGTYNYNQAIIEQERVPGVNFRGKNVPEVPFETAALTLGLESMTGWRWDASATWTYRGGFYTDELNTPFGGDPEGENGFVPEIWLLSARFNLDIGDTGASIWLSGDNLLDEFYITDREDGLKPGQGRTFWAGFKYKFE